MIAPCYLGVDPGATGALAVVNHAGLLIWVEDMPDPLHGAAIRDLIEGEGIEAAAIEQVHSMPRQGVASTFKFGDAYGLIKGCIGYAGIPYQTVPPTRWKKSYHLGPNKDQARTRATELWPAFADNFKRKKDDGRAEAALIARWCWGFQRMSGAA